MTPDEQAREAVRTFLREIWDTAQRNPKGKYDAQLDISIVLARLREMGCGEDALYYAKDARWLRNELTKCEAERDALRAQVEERAIACIYADERFDEFVQRLTSDAAVEAAAEAIAREQDSDENYRSGLDDGYMLSAKAAMTAALSVAKGEG